MKTPQGDARDLAATVFRHLDIPLDSQWVNPQGRPVPIVQGNGKPIPEWLKSGRTTAQRRVAFPIWNQSVPIASLI